LGQKKNQVEAYNIKTAILGEEAAIIGAAAQFS